MQRLRTLPLITIVLAALLLAACGGENEQGVSLEAANQRPTATPLPTAAPTVSAEDKIDALSGQFLLMRGHRYVLFDLATGEIRPFAQDMPAYSPLQLTTDRTRGAFVAFPNYGVVDIPARTATLIENRASDPQGISISPDGRWLIALTGTLSTRLTLLAADGSGPHSVAAGGGAIFTWAWTVDGRFVWWRTDQADSVPQVFDPATDSSAPLHDATTPVTVTFPRAVSPDGTRSAAVPIVPAYLTDPAECFDSYVGLLQAPFTLENFDSQGETIWTEPGLVASSPQWLDDDRLLFVKVGTGSCGTVTGDAAREVMLLDLSSPGASPMALVGPLGNADDVNDRTQLLARQYSHLYSVSPDGRYVAWIAGSLAEDESLLNVTSVADGTTRTALRITRAQAADSTEFIESLLLRQVVWLE